MNEHAYRLAERRFWATVGRTPTEHRIRLATTGTVVRVQEVGEGEPVLFIHGGPNAGSTWAPLLKHFDGYRCLLVDRPGVGLSEPYQIGPDNLVEFGSAFVGDVLDGLGVSRAHVVASSFGGHLALRSAGAHPERFLKIFQMACPAFAPGETAPPFMRLLTFKPARLLMGLLPPNDRVNRNIMRQIGHGASLDLGRISQDFFDWYLALLKYTDTTRNDSEMIARLVPERPSLTLPNQLLDSISVPTMFLWGEDDAFGGADVARYIQSRMPHAELTLIPDSGHLPWLDDPALAASAVAGFLGRNPMTELGSTESLRTKTVA